MSLWGTFWTQTTTEIPEDNGFFSGMSTAVGLHIGIYPMRERKTKAFKGKNGKHYIRFSLKQLSLASKINSKVAVRQGKQGAYTRHMPLKKHCFVVCSGFCARLWCWRSFVAVCRADTHELLLSFINSRLCAFILVKADSILFWQLLQDILAAFRLNFGQPSRVIMQTASEVLFAATSTWALLSAMVLSIHWKPAL